MMQKQQKMGGTEPGAEHLEEVPIGVESFDIENRIMSSMGK